MSRFEPTIEGLQESLEWHAGITAELQRRVLAARKRVVAHGGDPVLLAILDGRSR